MTTNVIEVATEIDTLENVITRLVITPDTGPESTTPTVPDTLVMTGTDLKNRYHQGLAEPEMHMNIKDGSTMKVMTVKIATTL